MREVKRVYGWATENPIGAFVSITVSLTLLILCFSIIAGFSLSASIAIPVLAISAVGGVLAAARVWIRTSPAAQMIKPPWMSWWGFFGLAVQVLLSGLILYIDAAHALGYWKFPRSTGPETGFDPALSPLAMTAIVVAVGLYRNQWWAFFFELVLLWVIISAVVNMPSHPTAHRAAASPEIPFMRECQAAVELFWFLSFNWWMIKRGFQRYNEQRNPVAAGL